MNMLELLEKTLEAGCRKHEDNCNNFPYGKTCNSYIDTVWASNPKEHIANMKLLWFSFKTKPEWLAMEQIEEYEKELLNK